MQIKWWGGTHTHTHKAREKRKKKKKTRKKAIYEWKQPWPSTVTASEDARQLLLTINKDKKRTNRVGGEQDSARVLVKKKRTQHKHKGGERGQKYLYTCQLGRTIDGAWQKAQDTKKHM